MSAHLISPFVAYNDKHRSLARLNAILHQGPYPCIHLFPHRKNYNIPVPAVPPPPPPSAAHRHNWLPPSISSLSNFPARSPPIPPISRNLLRLLIPNLSSHAFVLLHHCESCGSSRSDSLVASAGSSRSQRRAHRELAKPEREKGALNPSRTLIPDLRETTPHFRTWTTLPNPVLGP